MTITRLKLERFTAFETLDFKPSPGVNVLLGANGTGKTHLMKVAYTACDVSKTGIGFAEKIVRVFMPSGGAIGRLVKRRGTGASCDVRIHRGNRSLRISFSTRTKAADQATVAGAPDWSVDPVESVYIPVKEMLANAPGFRSLYSQREVHFEEIYADILDRAYLPALRVSASRERNRLLTILQNNMNGKVHAKNEEFFLRSYQGNLEFSLLAEGMRKLGLLWLLIQNGTLLEDSVLFWEEPETNLNPKLFGTVIEVLLELQRMGVQIFIATHDYAVLKEFDLQKKRRGQDRLPFTLPRRRRDLLPNGPHLSRHPSQRHRRSLHRSVRSRSQAQSCGIQKMTTFTQPDYCMNQSDCFINRKICYYLDQIRSRLRESPSFPRLHPRGQAPRKHVPRLTACRGRLRGSGGGNPLQSRKFLDSRFRGNDDLKTAVGACGLSSLAMHGQEFYATNRFTQPDYCMSQGSVIPLACGRTVGKLRARCRRFRETLPHSRESGNPEISMKTPCVYILASKPNGTLYVGVTSNLVQRIWQHRNDFVEGFTKRYSVHRLVWYEVHECMESAIRRERAIKKWNREWKIEMIEKSNPTWRDLHHEID